MRRLARLLSILPLLPALAAAEPQAPRVAVLPFKALASGQKEWIGAGLAEALTTGLSAVPDLRLVERAQVRALQGELRLIAQASKEADEDAGAIKMGRLLGASRLVLGSFQLAGGEILINGRFVATQSGVIAQTFQLRGKADRIFDLYPQLTERALKALGMRAPQEGKAREAYAATQAQPATLAAQELYVQGREAALSGTPEGLRQAADLLQRATLEDPSYALAFAALSEVQSQAVLSECAPLSWLRAARDRDPMCHIPGQEPAMDELARRAGFAGLDDAFEKTYAEAEALRKRCEKNGRLALSSATTAISLQPALPAAHRALGLAAWATGDRQKAEVEARTLLNLNRSEAFGYYLLGLCSTEPEESRRYHQRSLELDPLLLQNHYELAVWSFGENGDPQEKLMWGQVPTAKTEKEAEALAIVEEGLKKPGDLLDLHVLRAELLLRKAAQGQAPVPALVSAALAEAEQVLRRRPAHRTAHLVAALGTWWRGGPQRPWQAREKWQDEAALHYFRARLWEPKVCPSPRTRQPVDTFELGLPEYLLRGAAWSTWKAGLNQIYHHLNIHDSDLREPPRFCAGHKNAVLFLDNKQHRQVVPRWDRAMLLRHADPAIIDRWWQDRDWNQVVFEVVVCADPPISPDDEVRAELTFDREGPQPVWPPLGADGRESEKWSGSTQWNEAHGAPPRFSRLRGEVHLRGRFLYAPFRRVLEDGSEHTVRVRVLRGGKLLAEGQVPFRLRDQAEFQE